MKRNIISSTLAIGVGLILTTTAQAQVFVRAPFVRVQVGGGVYVRAPFVNLWIPPGPVIVPPPGMMYLPPLPRVVESPVPQQGELQQPQQQQQQQQQQPTPLPAPQKSPAPNNNDTVLPLPTKATKVPTLEQFSSTFQPKGGNYDLTIINPMTNQPTQVRFTLPEGNPRGVHLRRNEIEFDYGIRRFVRIEFDNEGAMVTSR